VSEIAEAGARTIIAALRAERDELRGEVAALREENERLRRRVDDVGALVNLRDNEIDELRARLTAWSRARGKPS
jgi:uncharacterized coiled-coil DUF342 family protein